MRFLDELIAAQIQSFCHKTQLLFGATNFLFARWSLVLFFSFILSFEFAIGSDMSSNYFMKLTCALLLMLAVMILASAMLTNVNRREKEAQSALHAMCKIGASSKDRVIRLAALVGGAGIVPNLILFGSPGASTQEQILFRGSVMVSAYSLIFFALYKYFLDCTPLPPAKSKVRKMFENIRAGLAPLEPRTTNNL